MQNSRANNRRVSSSLPELSSMQNTRPNQHNNSRVNQQANNSNNSRLNNRRISSSSLPDFSSLQYTQTNPYTNDDRPILPTIPESQNTSHHVINNRLVLPSEYHTGCALVSPVDRLSVQVLSARHPICLRTEYELNSGDNPLCVYFECEFSNQKLETPLITRDDEEDEEDATYSPPPLPQDKLSDVVISFFGFVSTSQSFHSTFSNSNTTPPCHSFILSNLRWSNDNPCKLMLDSNKPVEPTLIDHVDQMAHTPGKYPKSFGWFSNGTLQIPSESTPLQFSDTFNVHDVLGLGLNTWTGELFATKNGQLIHSQQITSIKIDGPNDKWYAAVGFQPNKHSPSVTTYAPIISVNLGAKPFLFDVEAKIRQEKHKLAKNCPSTPTDEKSIVNIVYNYLAHFGYQDSARVFLKSIDGESSQDEEKLIALKHECRIALQQKKPTKAIELLTQNVDEFNAHHHIYSRVLMYLHAQQVLEFFRVDDPINALTYMRQHLHIWMVDIPCSPNRQEFSVYGWPIQSNFIFDHSELFPRDHPCRLIDPIVDKEFLIKLSGCFCHIKPQQKEDLKDLFSENHNDYVLRLLMSCLSSEKKKKGISLLEKYAGQLELCSLNSFDVNALLE